MIVRTAECQVGTRTERDVSIIYAAINTTSTGTKTMTTILYRCVSTGAAA